jgi:hypothetical protein
MGRGREVAVVGGRALDRLVKPGQAFFIFGTRVAETYQKTTLDDVMERLSQLFLEATFKNDNDAADQDGRNMIEWLLEDLRLDTEIDSDMDQVMFAVCMHFTAIHMYTVTHAQDERDR